MLAVATILNHLVVIHYFGKDSFHAILFVIDIYDIVLQLTPRTHISGIQHRVGGNPPQQIQLQRVLDRRVARDDSSTQWLGIVLRGSIVRCIAGISGKLCRRPPTLSPRGCSPPTCGIGESSSSSLFWSFLGHLALKSPAFFAPISFRDVVKHKLVCADGDDSRAIPEVHIRVFAH